MSEVKSVLIEGDKSYFVSKGAIDRFKRDLKNDDKEKLMMNDYFKDGWTYQLVSNINNEIKVKILNKLDIAGKPRALEATEKRQLLKKRLNEMRTDRFSQSTLKTKLKTVPSDVADAYLSLKKAKLPISIHDPAEVFAKKEEYKNIVYTMIQSFGAFKGTNNPVINYYRLLAKHLEIPTEVPQQTHQQTHQHNEECNHEEQSASDFLEKMKTQDLKKEVESEMDNIYKSMGINKTDLVNDNDDKELNDILYKLGLSKEMTV